MDSKNYVFKFPKLEYTDKQVGTPGCLISELSSLKNNQKLFNDVKPFLYKANKNFLENLNKVSRQNINTITNNIVETLVYLLN